MKNFISNLKSLSNVTISQSDDTTKLTIHCSKNHTYHITIPHDIKEWFVDLYIKDSNKIIWSDWSEWYVLGDVTEENINEYYIKDISNFISKIISASDFEIENNTKLLKAKINNSWEILQLGAV